jgi:hypothetical protein
MNSEVTDWENCEFGGSFMVYRSDEPKSSW